MRGKTEAVLFDLDSTIADTSPRWHLSPLQNPSADWHTYAAACEDDIPILGTLRAMELHWRHSEVHICSLRAGTAQAQTEKWLKKHGAWYDVLTLDQNPPVHPDAETAIQYCADFKIRYIRRLRAEGIEVPLFYEDQVSIARLIAAVVPVVIVNPAYPKASLEWADGVGHYTGSRSTS